MSEPSRYSDNRLSRIYREGAWPEPGRQIDAAIHAASRRAARERHWLARRWIPALAVAAAAVLTSSLLLKAYREQREAVSPSTSDKPPAMRAKEQAPVSEPSAAEAKPAPSPPAATTPQGFSPTMDMAEAQRLDRLQRDLGVNRSLPARESPPPAPKAAPAEKPVSAATTQGAAVFGAKVAPAPASVQTQPPTQAPASIQAQPPAPASIQAQPPAQAPASIQAQPPVAATAAAPSAAVLPGETARSVRAANALERSPQAWLEDIRKLMTDGKSEEAGRELAEFRNRYPGFALPEDLR